MNPDQAWDNNNFLAIPVKLRGYQGGLSAVPKDLYQYYAGIRCFTLNPLRKLNHGGTRRLTQRCTEE